MRAFLSLIAILGLLLSPLGGCGSAPEPKSQTPGASAAATAPHTEPEPEHPVFMWRTRSATAVVHLLGSIHVGSKTMYPLDERIDRAFESSEVLVLEIDMDEEAEAKAAVAFVEMALLPKDQTVEDLLDDETKALLREKLDELGLSIEQVEMFRPWFVGLTIGLKELERHGYTGEYGIDRHFRERAVGKKEILELESVEEQTLLFASLTENAENEDLKMVLESDSGQQLEALTEEWLRGESRLIEEEVERARVDYPDAYAALYADRNHKMTAKIEGYLKTSKTYFVVAGGAHMVGDEGIVALLRDRGYAVEQL